MALLRKFFVIYLYGVFVYSTTAATLDDSNCVVTLTIPRDSIKSSCNNDDRVFRKMQALEAQFERMKRSLMALESRIPQIVNTQNVYNQKVNRVEFTLTRTGTYYKRLEERVHMLETRLVNDENTLINTQKRVVSPDTLMDPVRPYIMSEMQKYKASVHSSVVSEIVPKLLDSNSSAATEFKNDIVEKLREEIISSLSTKQEYFNPPSLNRTKTTTVSSNTTFRNATYDKRNFSILARTFHGLNVSRNNTNFTDRKVVNENGNATSDDKDDDFFDDKDNDTSTRIPVYATSDEDIREIIASSLQEIKEEILQETREEVEELTQKYLQIQKNMTDILGDSNQRYEEIKNSTRGEFKHEFGKVNVTLVALKKELWKLDRKVEEPMNDLTIDSKIDQRLLAERPKIQKDLMDSLSFMLSAIQTKIDQQTQRINMSADFVNIFKQTLIKQKNESETMIHRVNSTVLKLAKKIEEFGQFRLDNQVIMDKVKFLQDEVQSVVDSQLFAEGEMDAYKQSSNENVRENQNKIREVVNKINDLEFQLNILNGVKTVLGKQEIQDNVTMERVKVLETRVGKVESDFNIHRLQFSVGDARWVEYNFTDFSIRNECRGKKYVKLNTVSNDVAKYVGVQLCNPQRYKIFLGNSLEDEFYDIGDTHNFGEDHCQFVGATDPSGPYKVQGEFVFMHKIYAAYYRAEWDEPLKFGTLNMMRPTSNFYECGVKIP